MCENMVMRRKRMMELADDLIRQAGLPISVRSSRDPHRVVMRVACDGESGEKCLFVTHEYALGLTIIAAHEAGIGMPEAVPMVLALYDNEETECKYPDDIHVPGYCQSLHGYFGYPWYDPEPECTVTVPDEQEDICIWSWMTVRVVIQDECLPTPALWHRKVLVPHD